MKPALLAVEALLNKEKIFSHQLPKTLKTLFIFLNPDIITICNIKAILIFFMLKNTQNNTKFKTSLMWNGLESFIAQLLVTIHHIMLQAYSGAKFHGLFSSHLSIIYTLIPIFNLGFDYALSPHLQYFTSTRKNFSSIIALQFLPQLLITYLATCFIFHPLFYSSFSGAIITPDVAFWLKSLFVIEYVRKSARSLLQLMLYTKVTAFTEITGTVFYMTTFWVLIWLFKLKLDLLMAFKLFAFFAFIQTLVLFIQLAKIYWFLNKKSPDATEIDLKEAHISLTKNRFGIWTNHIVSQINYSHFIVPFISALFGLTQASILTILMNSARCIKLFFQKGLGTSSLALLSQSREQENSSAATTYSYPIYYLYNFSIPLLIFFTMNSAKLSYIFSENQPPYLLIYAACFLSVTEGAISVYEKFYIAEKKIYLFSALNTIGSLLLFIIAYQFSLFNNLSHFFLAFFLVRTTAFLTIALLSHHIFKLSTFPKINRYILSAAVLFSIIFYLLF